MNSETRMQESKTYQLLTERITKEITIEHILVVLKTKFPTDNSQLFQIKIL